MIDNHKIILDVLRLMSRTDKHRALRAFFVQHETPGSLWLTSTDGVMVASVEVRRFILDLPYFKRCDDPDSGQTVYCMADKEGCFFTPDFPYPPVHRVLGLYNPYAAACQAGEYVGHSVFNAKSLLQAKKLFNKVCDTEEEIIFDYFGMKKRFANREF